MGLDFKPERGLADNGDLEHDLQALLAAAGEAAKSADTAMAIFVGELQYVPEEQLAALITALHRDAQRQLPVVLVGAGLKPLCSAGTRTIFDGTIPTRPRRQSIVPRRCSRTRKVCVRRWETHRFSQN